MRTCSILYGYPHKTTDFIRNAISPDSLGEVHQMDFVGLRHIKGYGRISSLNLIGFVSEQGTHPAVRGADYG